MWDVARQRTLSRMSVTASASSAGLQATRSRECLSRCRGLPPTGCHHSTGSTKRQPACCLPLCKHAAFTRKLALAVRDL